MSESESSVTAYKTSTPDAQAYARGDRGCLAQHPRVGDSHRHLVQRILYSSSVSHAAAGEHVSGNPEPLGRVVAQDLPATFLSTRGDVTTGTRDVWERYEREAS